MHHKRMPPYLLLLEAVVAGFVLSMASLVQLQSLLVLAAVVAESVANMASLVWLQGSPVQMLAVYWSRVKGIK